MKSNTTRHDRRCFWLAAVVALTALVAEATAEPVPITVAVVKSWSADVLPVFQELNDHWSTYGDVPLTVDTSLQRFPQFTYQDLVDTAADVIWLSDPAGDGLQYSLGEIDAIRRYLNAGHSILGTYAVFQHGDCDNRELAPLFGLRSDIAYKVTGVAQEVDQTFDVLIESDLFEGIGDPYETSGYASAQVPVEDLTWDAVDLAGAQMVAKTEDSAGVITQYDAGPYHAIYVSQMVEYEGGESDTQFLYNALTMVPEPGMIALVGMGCAVVLALRGRRKGRR